MTPYHQSIRAGLCQCGCGMKTKPCPKTMTKRGWIKGQPMRYITGHNGKILDGLTASQRRRNKLRENGMCVACGSRPSGNRTLTCAKCAETKRIRRGIHSNGLLDACVRCGAPIDHDRPSKYCSRCRTRKCSVCGELFNFRGRNPDSYCCSLECANRVRSLKRGPLANNWRGGRTAERNIVRSSAEYRAWRVSVFVRDGHTCQHCGARNGMGATVHLHAHHIKEFAIHPGLRLEVSNGVTLCHPCHEAVHGKKIPATKQTIKGKFKGTKIG